MISQKEVRYNLKKLEGLFNASIIKPKAFRETNFYGKLAVLEASAWLEECVEDIFSKVATSKLTVPLNLNEYLGKIDSNHGFNYHKYIKNKLSINLFGYVLTEKIETELSTSTEFQNMQAALRSLTRLRGDLAHNHLTGATPTVQSVSTTLHLFNDAIKGLKVLEKRLKKVKFK